MTRGYNPEIYDESTQPEGEAPYYTNIPTEEGQTYVEDAPVPQKPPDEEFEIFNKWNRFKEYYVDKNFGGIDPNEINPQKSAVEARDEYIKGIIKKHGGQIYDQNLYKTIMKRADDIAKMTYSSGKDKKEKMSKELETTRGWFEKDTREKLKEEGRLELLRQKQAEPPKEMKKTDKDKEYGAYAQSITDQINAGSLDPKSKPMTRDAYFRWRQENYEKIKAKYRKSSGSESIIDLIAQAKGEKGKKIEPDEFGYTAQEQREDREGNLREYIGDNQWRLVK